MFVSTVARRVILGISTVLLVGTGAAAVVGNVYMHHVSASGICFSGPTGSTATWAYNPGSDRLNLRYYLPPVSDATSASYRRAATLSFKAWSHAWPVLHFIRVSNPNRASIVVKYGVFGRTGEWFDHAGLTVPDFDMFGCSLNHATIEINDSYLVSHGSVLYPMHMLRHLFVHEIGHALGLKHVYSPHVSVMVPTSNAYIWDKPQRYDIATISALYPSSSSNTHLLSPVSTTPSQAASNSWHGSLSTLSSRP